MNCICKPHTCTIEVNKRTRSSRKLQTTAMVHNAGRDDDNSFVWLDKDDSELKSKPLLSMMVMTMRPCKLTTCTFVFALELSSPLRTWLKLIVIATIWYALLESPPPPSKRHYIATYQSQQIYISPQLILMQ